MVANDIAHFAGRGDDAIGGLHQQGVFPQLRTVLQETPYVAVRAATVQCLSVVAARPRFRGIVGIQLCAPRPL
jgi:hypothetical protein